MKTCPVDCRDLVRCFCRYTSPAPLARTRKPPMMARDLEYIRTFRERTETKVSHSRTLAMRDQCRKLYNMGVTVVLTCQYDFAFK